MKKLLALLAILIVLLVGTLFVLEAQLDKPYTSIKDLPYTHSNTKAICTKTNYCMDYEIICKNSNIVDMGFTGAAIQLPENWKDPRSEKQKEFC